MASEPVNERPIFPAPTRADALGFSIWSTSMIRQLTQVFQQYGYRLNLALLEEDLETEGGTVLSTDNLVTNGGDVPEVDSNNTWTGTNTFTGTHTVASPSVLQGETWNSPTLLNGWENYGTSFTPARYRKLSSGLVVVQGLIRFGTGTAGTVLFVLPAGYRPDNNLIFNVRNTSGATARLDVKNNGNVQIDEGAATAWLSLNIQFPADQ